MEAKKIGMISINEFIAHFISFGTLNVIYLKNNADTKTVLVWIHSPSNTKLYPLYNLNQNIQDSKYYYFENSELNENILILFGQ